jgi:hypothetical protein
VSAEHPRSLVRQSFWFTRPVVAVADHQSGVTAGSVGDGGLDVDGDGESATEVDLLTVAVWMNRWNPRLRNAAPSRPWGSPAAAPCVERSMCSAGRLVEVVAVEVRDVQVVGLGERLLTRSGRWSLRGKTNHEPKKAGVNHGSQAMVAWRSR